MPSERLRAVDGTARPAHEAHESLLIDAKASSSAIYMLRTLQQNQVQLTLMADNKANILIAACFIAISLLGGRLASEGWNGMLGGIFALALMAAIFGVLAVIPRSTLARTLTPEHNLLFFGHYALLEQRDFLSRMNEALQSDQQIYQTMLKDIYGSGRVLKRKYLLLRYSYLLFLAAMGLPLLYLIFTEWVLPNS